MNWLLAVLDVIIVFSIFFVVQYLRKLPDQVHKKNLKVFELDLSKQLELFRTDLRKEIELLKISEAQLYMRKAEEFTNLIELIAKEMLDKTNIEKMKTDAKLRQEFNRRLMDLGTKLFFFASDETVKKYVEWRKIGQLIDSPGFDPRKIVFIMAELMVQIRKDLGYKNTTCDTDDFLNIILSNWEAEKKKMSL